MVPAKGEESTSVLQGPDSRCPRAPLGYYANDGRKVVRAVHKFKSKFETEHPQTVGTSPLRDIVFPSPVPVVSPSQACCSRIFAEQCARGRKILGTETPWIWRMLHITLLGVKGKEDKEEERVRREERRSVNRPAYLRTVWRTLAT